ncbi:MAG: S8 family serine peptidase [Planctomycetaceae bacterium]
MRIAFSVFLGSVLLSCGHVFTAAAPPVTRPFPKTGLLPKEEIGALRLLKKHPTYDGRGVVVAIFDTGVDPGAAGLQTTADGRPKVVDVIDATGSGDVVLTGDRKPIGGLLKGLTGRELKVDPRWHNPTGNYRLGMKAGYDLFPGAMVARLKRERRKAFLEAHRKVEAKLRRQIARWNAKHPKPNVAQRRHKAELAERLTQLRGHANQRDPGPVFDCVVFHDGKRWQAVVDTDEDGNLAEEKLLNTFRVNREYGTFGNGYAVNFAVNFYGHGRGKRLSLVVESGAHGTHVAGIVAAHYPKQPELNGIAPGAQIVSVKIGDTRMGGMETGAALVRGLRAVVDAKCDLINMSYGEATNLPNRGRLIDLCNEIVRRQGVIFVASAGNEGPALSTVGSPGGTTADVIGVGAYVSPQMMAVEYTLRKKLPGMPYTWTSRGPTFDGDMGVDVFAPGGAIAPVPTWTLQKSMRMNGTSMASPNACGGIALLLSGMKATNTPCTPFSVQRAIKNTARRIESADRFAQGPGLFQVDKALEHLLKHAGDTGEQLRYSVSIGGKRGLYLREPRESSRPKKVSVSVRPQFPEKTKPKTKIGFELRVALKATAEWVSVGGHAVMTRGGTRFNVAVDPTQLAPGAHYAEVQGFDAANPSRGPLFRVPVTILRTVGGSPAVRSPASATPSAPRHRETVAFKPGTIARRFFVVPDGATWADLQLSAKTGDGEGRRFVVHTVRAQYGQSIDSIAERNYVMLSDGKPHAKSFAVTGGHLLEVCLAQYWSSLDPCDVDVSLTFRGLTPDRNRVTLSPGSPTARVDVRSPFRKQTLAPQAVLTTHRSFHRPKSAVIRPLDPKRDRLPDGTPVSELVLTYEFAYAGSVTPRFPQLDGLLYDSPVGNHFWMLFDPAKRRIAADDMWPRAVRLGKGTHMLKLQIRHTSIPVLKRFQSMPLVLDAPMRSKIKLAGYRSRTDAVLGTSAFETRTIGPGGRVAIVFRAPGASQIPKAAVDGDLLLGTVSYGKADFAQPGTESRPGGYPLQYVVAATGRTRVAKKPATAAIPLTGSWTARLRKLKLAELNKLAESGSATKRFESIAGELLKKDPHDLDVLIARLKFLDHVKFRKTRLGSVVKAADAVLARIDADKLARHFGTNVNPEDPKAVARRKTMDRRKAILTDTLYRKGRALGYMELPDVIARHPIADRKAHDKAFEANFAELRKWADTTDKTHFLLHVRRERRRGHYAAALKLLDRHTAGAAPNYWYVKKRRDLFGDLGWKHLQAWEARRLMVGFPKAFEAF